MSTTLPYFHMPEPLFCGGMIYCLVSLVCLTIAFVSIFTGIPNGKEDAVFVLFLIGISFIFVTPIIEVSFILFKLFTS
jgi:hypothetical protein